MDDWHTCDTTHCRAGWVVHLAGEKGYALEKATSCEFAAMQIYKASSDIKISCAEYYRSNEEAMNNIKECAALEAAA